MKKTKLNSTNLDNTYPIISDKLIECLERDYPNQLPENEISPFELGKQIGIQTVIKKLKIEKQFNEIISKSEEQGYED